ncbi:hypothetical protein [Aeromonas bivalvium]|uniref:hypothetical protein n=1 Tax=Aeromonas bivalvium TaxID=440079 RepID=UPI000DCFA98C|nr:hypothetical protein [Aeromonas bivalvium]
MSEHTKGLLRVGHSGAVVADHPVPGMGGSDAVEYYGGHLVAESVTAANARRLVACWNACHGLPTDELEQKGLVAAVGNQLLDLERERDDWQKALGAVLATIPNKDVVRASGVVRDTVAYFKHLHQQRDVLLEALNGVQGVMSNSQGVAGWHKNGAIATWDELLPEVAAALEFVEGEQS